MYFKLNKGNNKGSPLLCIRKDPVSQLEKIVLIGISSGINYNHGFNDIDMIFYSISFYHKWISDVITGDTVRISVERNTGSPNSQIKPLFLFLFFSFFICHAFLDALG